MTTTEPHRALAHRCPFCRADPGQACRTHRGRGAETNWPHSRRVELVNPVPKIPPTRAICCTCGSIRTCKEPRNKRGYWGDPNWHRQLGDLKCQACGRATTHALLEREDRVNPNIDEIMQQVALGAAVPQGWHFDAERLRRTYRETSVPRNPNLHHWFDKGQADKLRGQGETHMPALCGDIARIPESWGGDAAHNNLIEPDDIDWDTELEDPETGLWWVDMDCVNCLHVTNERRRKRRRERLESWLAWFACHPEAIPDEEADALNNILGPLADAIRQRER